ncbi:MAG: hypothetical protein KDA63_12890 [Planctomycetales bacterium]|nr:hypothetical protein [Planctomycetales bacterium]
MDTLGASLIAELSQRGQRGMYFKFDAYQALQEVDEVGRMQRFLDENGYRSVLAADDPVWIADGLEEAAEDEGPPWWAHNAVGGLLWFVTRLYKKRRCFPRRCRNLSRYRIHRK